MGWDEQEKQRRLALARGFFDMIPHGRVLGCEIVDVEPNTVVARIAYRKELVGNPFRRHIHGGVLTTLIDQTCGCAAVSSFDPPQVVATLDLRVDHMKPAEPERDVYARAHCYRVTSQIAFARCVAYQDDPSDPIATSMSTFMRIGRADASMMEGVE